MSVAVLISLLAKVTSHIAVDNGFVQHHALQEGKGMGGKGKEGKESNKRGRGEGWRWIKFSGELGWKEVG